MEFDSHHKVKIGTLTQQQAKKFDKWLLKELLRHLECIHDAHRDMNNWPEIKEIFESAVTRHKGDIQGISELRIKLRELFEL